MGPFLQTTEAAGSALSDEHNFTAGYSRTALADYNREQEMDYTGKISTHVKHMFRTTCV